MLSDAAELYERAQDAHRRGSFQKARALLERARALNDDPDLLGRIELSLAYVEAETGSAGDGILACNAALELPDLSGVTQGLIWSQRGLLQLRAGDQAAALKDFELAIPRLQDEPEFLGRAYLNQGNVYLHLGDPVQAAASLTCASEALTAAGAREQAAKAQHNLGYVRLLTGDVVTALRLMDEAAQVLAPISAIMRAVGEQDRAEVLLAAGRPHEAITALEAAVSEYGSQRLRRFQAECEFVLARTLVSDDPAMARDVARRAARRFERHGSPGWAMRAQAIALIAEIESGATTSAVLAKADSVGAHLRKAHQRQDADRLALHAARLTVRRGDLDDAALRAAAVRTNEDSPVTTRLLAREVRAELAAAHGHSGRVRLYARRGLAELHAWQSTFGSLDLQTSTVGHGEHLARLGLRAAIADGTPAVVFEWSERARALASRVSSLRPPPDPVLAGHLTALRVADPNDLALRRSLREQIRSHSWFAAQGTVGEPTNLEALQARLAVDDSALVAHIVLDGTVTALAVTAHDAVVHTLGDARQVRAILDRVSADLDFAAHNRDGAMANAIRSSLRADLAQLADVLIRPVLATVGYRRLVLTPSALLTGTPWTELPGLIGRPITVPTSATQWLNRAERHIAAVREVGLLAGPRLTRAEEEVQRAQASWPRAHVLAGAEADAARAGWLASRVDLLHIAGHGSHPGDHPLFAAVELADGPWFGHDIDLLPRVPEVVVLSACDLGQSSVLHGEESVGMSAVWLHAGARAVVSSLALLSDDLACEVFASWHQLVSTGAAPADALAQVSAGTDDVLPLLCFGAGW